MIHIPPCDQRMLQEHRRRHLFAFQNVQRQRQQQLSVFFRKESDRPNQPGLRLAQLCSCGDYRSRP